MLLVLIPGVGMWGIWWTAGLTWMISALFCLLRYFSWRRKVKDVSPAMDAGNVANEDAAVIEIANDELNEFARLQIRNSQSSAY